MKNYLLLLTVLLISCNRDKTNKPNTFIEKDSPSYYFLKSQDMKLEATDRLKAVNKAIEMTGGLDSHGFSGQLAYHKNWLHFSSGQNDSLIFYHHKVFEGPSKNIDYYYLGQEYYLMGYYFSEVVRNSEEAFRNYTLSKGYFQKIRDSSWVGRNLLNMGTIQKDKSDFFGSKETLTDALKYLNSRNDKTYMVQCYNLLATNHRKLLNFDDALTFYNKAIKLTDSPTDKFIYQNNLAATYIDNHQLKMAINLLDSISSIPIPVSNQKEYARVLDNLAYSKWLSGNKIKENEFQKPLQIRIQNNDKRGQIASYTHLGEFHSETNPGKATSYFDSVIILSKTLKIPRAEKDALKFLMELEPTNVQLRDRYVFLQDSLYKQELKVKTQFAKYKYDDKLKQESILRLEKDNAEKELEANQERTQKILYLGGFIFTTTILGLSLFGFRQRTKRLKQQGMAKTLEAIQETEAELSRKLHDDHGGKLNQLMSLIQIDADKEIILDKTEELYNHTRDFSRTLNSVDTGPDFWNILKATLEFAKPAEVEMMFNGGKELNWSTVSDQSKTILFKVLQELIINMARHSKAQQTVIIFKEHNKILNVYYEDDGVGASKESLFRKNGLQNTEKRIQAIGGSIIFDSEEGKGFRAEIHIPK
ncbi:hypothetical protein ACOCEA_02450 [Maribacter sp. CXY002]|uniref:tetratricopeptide repeat-containing sensor histidine kinase n=1 Tax=Maribacter luteocoastalis TaxID=3407671 RepID=UPI003B680F98